MWVYPFEFRQWILPFQSISTLAISVSVRQSASGLQFFYWMIDVRYTFLYSNKYNKTHFTVGFLPIIIVPTIQHIMNNQYAVSHLTYLLSLLTYRNWLHAYTNILTYLFTNVFQAYLYEREWIWQATSCCIRLESSIYRILVKSPLVRYFIKFCI